MMPCAVPRQAQLPLSMAAAVVAQGIKIRLGRSIVTITGIVLGIAFLVSILGSQALRRGVAAEDRLREEANRQYGYLVAETGGLARRSLAVMVTSRLEPTELRLLQRLEREGISELRVWSPAPALPPGTFERLSPRVHSQAAPFGAGAACLLVLGKGALPELAWSTTISGLKQPLIAVTSEPRDARLQQPGVNLLRLGRELPAEERARLEQSLQREHFRGLWIIVISLLVTVIGISNAMLMSVTERFRDIGTMKCLGATSRFIRQIFLLEASFMGLVGGVLGVVLGLAVSIATYLVLYDAALVWHTLGLEAGAVAKAAGQALFAGVALSVVAALYPAQFAAKMVPADALRSNV
jgi:ABC-type antimicrobial peptide transport system permease subunit